MLAPRLNRITLLLPPEDKAKSHHIHIKNGFSRLMNTRQGKLGEGLGNVGRSTKLLCYLSSKTQMKPILKLSKLEERGNIMMNAHEQA